MCVFQMETEYDTRISDWSSDVCSSDLRSRMSAQFELNQNFSFLTPGLTFRGILNTNRYSFFDVSRQYSPFYYNMVDYDKLSGLYALNLINNQPGEATEYLDYTPGGKEIKTFLYMQGVLNYSRDIGRSNIS